MGQQIARRIAGRGQLGEHDEVGDVGLGAGHGGAHSLEVGVERADRQVELGGRQAHGAMISDTKMLTWAVLLALVLAAQGFAGPAADVLQAVRRPRRMSSTKFDEDAAFAVTREGEYVVLDRRGHGLYVLDAAGAKVRRIVSAGTGPGELFNPLALALNADDLIAVADSPNGLDRVQYFASNGLRVGGFYLPLTPRASTDGVERAHRERRFAHLFGLDVRGQSAGVGRARDRARRHGPGRSPDGQSAASWPVTRIAISTSR